MPRILMGLLQTRKDTRAKIKHKKINQEYICNVCKKEIQRLKNFKASC